MYYLIWYWILYSLICSDNISQANWFWDSWMFEENSTSFKGVSLISDFKDTAMSIYTILFIYFLVSVRYVTVYAWFAVDSAKAWNTFGKFSFWEQMVQFACHCFKGLLSPLLSVSGLFWIFVFRFFFFLFSQCAFFVVVVFIMRINSLLLIILEDLRVS